MLWKMGKRGSKGREGGAGIASSSGLHTSLSLREEASGRKPSHNPKSLLKLKHLQNLAEWGSKEASASHLGSFFGYCFAEFGEALGIRPDPSLFPCQRCETLLHPAFNCNVRIEKNLAKRRHHRGKTNRPRQNNVVYTCNFCYHRNLMRGTLKGHVKEVCPPKTILSSQVRAGNLTAQRCDNVEKNSVNKVKARRMIDSVSPETGDNTGSFTDSQAQAVIVVKLLDSNRSKRKKSAPKGLTDQSVVGSAPIDTWIAGGTSNSRKKRKSRTTLKEIAQREKFGRNQRFQKCPIPFHL